MEIVKRLSFNSGEKLDVCDPRSVVAFISHIRSLIMSSGADPYVNNLSFRITVPENERRYLKLQKEYDDYISWFEFDQDCIRTNQPRFNMPNFLVVPTRDVLDVLKFSQQRLIEAQKEKALAQKSSGLVLEVIKKLIPSIVEANLHDVFHTKKLDNHIQVQQAMQFIGDHYLGDSVDFRSKLDGLIRNHLVANNLSELKLMFENIIILHAEMVAHYEVASMTLDLQEMNKRNTIVPIFNSCSIPISSADLTTIILSKISKSHSSNLLFFQAKLNQFPTKFPSLESVSMLIKEFTNNLPTEISKSVLVTPTLYDIPLNTYVNQNNNAVANKAEVGTCNFWNGKSCSSIYSPCRFQHILGVDTRKSFNRNDIRSRSNDRSSYSNSMNNNRDRSRSRDRSPYSKDRFQNRSSGDSSRSPYSKDRSNIPSRDRSPSRDSNRDKDYQLYQLQRELDNYKSNNLRKYTSNIVQDQSQLLQSPQQVHSQTSQQSQQLPQQSQSQQTPQQLQSQYHFAPGTPYRE